jgi:hypothetical protein
MKNSMKASNKIVTRFIFSVMAIVAITSFSNCGNDTDTPIPSKQEEVKALLTASAWKVNTVSVDDKDQTTTYKDLGLTFTNTSFTSTNGAAIWPASGTWAFTSDAATAFTIDGGLEVTLQEVTATSLKLALTWSKSTLSSGRQESLSGKHVFTFRK